MSSRRKRTPKYRHYKPKNLAVVRINGRDHYLGKYESSESYERYDRLIADWLRGRRSTTSGRQSFHARSDNGCELTSNELILAYWDFAKSHYVRDGQPTDEQHGIRAAMRPLRRLYGHTPAEQFGPKALKLVRQAMIEAGHSRRYICDNIGRIRRMFKWAVSDELLPVSVYHALQTVEGLKKGRSGARETKPVRPVPDEHVDATLDHINPIVGTMIRVQLLAGMRPQDVRNMRICDIDRSRDVWVYTPSTHKTQHLGMTRRIALGPRAQTLLQTFLNETDDETYVFSPRTAVDIIRAARRQQRKTPLTPSQSKRKPKTDPKRQPGQQYSKGGYEKAIARACERAGVPHWTPNQLRHSCATKIRTIYGAEGAAAVLGNSLGMVVEVYAESNFALAVTIMREVG